MAIDSTPVYRYITADFLTGKVLSELNCTNVSYERALKNAGSFSGIVPITAGTDLSLIYSNTMPGKTALYVLRNNVVVWGGLIWSRNYDLVGRTLSLSGSEFHSYFAKRLIWKTYDFSFDAKIKRNYKDNSGKAEITIPNNKGHYFVPGSSFQTSFNTPYTQWSNLRNYVLDTPTPKNDSSNTPNTEDNVKVISKNFGYSIASNDTYNQFGITNATVNLITNPSFETNTTGWTAGTNTTIARNTSNGFVGTSSLSLTSVAAGNIWANLTTSVSATVGYSYTASAYVKSAAISRTARVRLDWYNGASLLSSTDGTNTSTSTTAWTRLSVTGTAPSSTTAVVVTMTVNSTAAGSEVHYFDAVLLEQSSVLNDYFDTGVINYTYSSNLVTNPSFDANTTDWSSPSGLTLSRVTTQNYDGTTAAALQLVNATGVQYATATNKPGGSRLLVRPGETYTFSYYIKNSTSTSQWFASLKGFAAISGGSSVFLVDGTVTTISTSSWTRLSVTATIPATGVSYLEGWVANASADIATATVFVDAVMLEKTSTLNTYNPSGTTNPSVFSYASITSTSGNLAYDVFYKQITAVNTTLKTFTVTATPSSTSLYNATLGTCRADITLIKSKKNLLYLANIETNIPHNMSVGQNAHIINVDKYFNGTHRVIAVPDANTNGTAANQLSYHINSIPKHNITAVNSLSSNLITLTMVDTHYLVKGSHITIANATGTVSGTNLANLNGTNYVVQSIDGNTSITVKNLNSFTKPKSLKQSDLSTGQSFGDVTLNYEIPAVYLNKAVITSAVSGSTTNYTFVITASDVTNLLVGQWVNVNFTYYYLGTPYSVNASTTITAIGSGTFTIVLSSGTVGTIPASGLTYPFTGQNYAVVQTIPYEAVNTSVAISSLPMINPSDTVFSVNSRYTILNYKTTKEGAITLTLSDPNHLLNTGVQCYLFGLAGTNASLINNNGYSSGTDERAIGYTITSVGGDGARSIVSIEYGNETKTFTDYTSNFKVSATGSSGANTVTVGSATGLAVGQAVKGTGVATGSKIKTIVGTTVTLTKNNTGAVSGNITLSQGTAYLELFPNTVSTNKFWGQDSGFAQATVVAQTNAYEYVRDLINQVLKDFDGYSFDNLQLQPGVKLGDVSVKNYSVSNSTVAGYSTVKLITDSTSLANITNATVTNANVDGSTISYTASNSFYQGQVINITGVKSTNNSTPTDNFKFNINNAIIVSATSTAFTVETLNDLTGESYVSSSGTAKSITKRHQFVAGQQIGIKNIGKENGNTFTGNVYINSVADGTDTNYITFDTPTTNISSGLSLNTNYPIGSTFSPSIVTITPNGPVALKSIFWNQKTGITYCTLSFTGANRTAVKANFKVNQRISTVNIDSPDAKNILYDNPNARITKITDYPSLSTPRVDLTYVSAARGLTHSGENSKPDGYDGEINGFAYTEASYSNGTAKFYIPQDFSGSTEKKQKINVGDKLTITSQSNSNNFYDTKDNELATVTQVQFKQKPLTGSDDNKNGTVISVTYASNTYLLNKKSTTRASVDKAKKYAGKIYTTYKSLNSYSTQVSDYSPRIIKDWTISSNSFGEFPNNGGMGGLKMSIENKISSFAYDNATGLGTITTDTNHGFFKDSVVNSIASYSVIGSAGNNSSTVTILTSDRNSITIGDIVQVTLYYLGTLQTSYSGTFVVTSSTSPQDNVGPWAFTYEVSGVSTSIARRAATGSVNSNRSSVIISVNALSTDTTTVSNNKEFLNGRWLIYGQTSSANTLTIYKPTGHTQNPVSVNGASVNADGTVTYYLDSIYEYRVGSQVSITGIPTNTDLNCSNQTVIDTGNTPTTGNYIRITYTPSTTTYGTYPSTYVYEDSTTWYTTATSSYVSLSQTLDDTAGANGTLSRNIVYDAGISISNDIIRGGDYTVLSEHLDTYSNFVNGFEYRIDSAYNSTTNKFENTFVFVPNNYQNPKPWIVSDPSRFGADKIQFEYPGNIFTISLDENAETAVTRHFSMSDGSTGDQTTAPYSAAASSTDLLANGWPILETSNKISWPLLADAFTGKAINNVDNWGNGNPETDLYKTATRYLIQARPPMGTMSVTVNGSAYPYVGTYSPGDWCVLNFNNDFLKQRLASGLEPRSSTFVRKIDGYSVQVPNNPAQPETVTLKLATDWLVDRFQAQIDADYEVVIGIYK